jgi:hypothetical protein
METLPDDQYAVDYAYGPEASARDIHTRSVLPLVRPPPLRAVFQAGGLSPREASGAGPGELVLTACGGKLPAVRGVQVERVVNGMNCAVVAFGATASGKTHTLEGAGPDGEEGVVVPALHALYDELFAKAKKVAQRGSQGTRKAHGAYDFAVESWCCTLPPPPASPRVRPSGGRRSSTRGTYASYSDEKVANRDIRVWHGATETGP